MMLLNTSLLRERFIIKEHKDGSDVFIALGNRILLPLKTKNGEFSERFIIRAKSMHLALRMAAEITDSFYRIGPLSQRIKSFPWKEIWDEISGEFDRPHYGDDVWISVYYNGRPIFKNGQYHPFLDVIEQCDIKNRAEYDKAITIATDLFQQSGRNYHIDHLVNIAAVIGVTETQSRCGLILRAPRYTSTFNVAVKPRKGNDFKTVPPERTLILAATYLEGIELAYTAGQIQNDLNAGRITKTSDKAKFQQAALNRIGRLNKIINNYETFYDIYYRPEKPEFINLMRQSEAI